MVSGYRKNVGWIESAAFELIYLSEIQRYQRLGRFRDRLRTQYEGMASALGFVASLA